MTHGASPSEDVIVKEESGHTINFNDVPVIEVIRFVSRISEVNFIFNSKELEFNITLASGRPVASENVLKALIQMLKMHGMGVTREEDYYVIHKGGKESKDAHHASNERRKVEEAIIPSPLQELAKTQPPANVLTGLTPALPPIIPAIAPSATPSEPREFFVYKLQYHQGAEIDEAIKKIAADLHNQPEKPTKLLDAIQSMQWVKMTNSLLCSGDPETIVALKKLISSLDVPLRQVFIEVLVIETDVRKAMEFGLEWALGGKYKDKLGFGMGGFSPDHGGQQFASTMKSINADSTPTGLGQVPTGEWF